jgi:hypothetical protein
MKERIFLQFILYALNVRFSQSRGILPRGILPLRWNNLLHVVSIPHLNVLDLFIMNIFCLDVFVILKNIWIHSLLWFMSLKKRNSNLSKFCKYKTQRHWFITWWKELMMKRNFCSTKLLFSFSLFEVNFKSKKLF